MNEREIETWSRWASPATVAAVDDYARFTRDDWRRRLPDPGELLALLDWCGGSIVVELAARAAALAAIELAVILHVYPRPLDLVLRPSWRWTG